jgi:hypothetical protein
MVTSKIHLVTTASIAGAYKEKAGHNKSLQLTRRQTGGLEFSFCSSYTS